MILVSPVKNEKGGDSVAKCTGFSMRVAHPRPEPVVGCMGGYKPIHPQAPSQSF
jgi:hypothetical protein